MSEIHASEAQAATTTECGTCRRHRPVTEFVIPSPAGDGISWTVKICRACREKLWTDPMSPQEAYPWAH